MPEGHELLDEDESTSPHSATPRSCTAPGPASPTSPSRSRSSRSWRAASPRSASAGTTAARPPSPGAGRSSSVFILIIGLCMSELVSALPDLGRNLLVGSQTRRRQGRLLHRLAEPDRPDRHPGVGGLRLRDVPRPDAGHLQRELARRLQPDQDVHHVPGHPGGRRDHQHLLSATCWPSSTTSRCGGMWSARPRSILILLADPRAARQLLRRVRHDRQQHRHVRRRHVGLRLAAVRAADLGDPDPVHDHRLRRLGAPVRGDQERGRRRGQGHLAVDLLLRPSAAGSCCCPSCSPSRTSTGVTTGGGAVAVDLQPGDGAPSGSPSCC